MRVLLLQRVNIGDLTTGRRKFLTELSVHLLHVPGVFPGLPERPLDFLHPIPQLLVPLLQRCHFLLQLLHSVLLLKQRFLHWGAHELRGQEEQHENKRASHKSLLKQGVPWNTPQLYKSRMLFLEVLSYFHTFFSKILSFTSILRKDPKLLILMTLMIHNYFYELFWQTCPAHYIEFLVWNEFRPRGVTFGKL